MWFAFLLLALATCRLQTVQGLQPVLLNLPSEEVQVTATAECGVAADGSSLPTEYVVCPDGPDCVRTCGKEIAHHAQLAVDGDRSTSWQSPPLSFYQARGESIDSHNLTIDLGRVSAQSAFSFYEALKLYMCACYLHIAGSTCDRGRGICWGGHAPSHHRALYLCGWN